MTLTLHLSDDTESALKARAEARGLSAEQYAEQVLADDLKAGLAGRPITEVICDIWSDLPEEVRNKLPVDGAAQIDHYVYGLPKRSA